MKEIKKRRSIFSESWLREVGLSDMGQFLMVGLRRLSMNDEG